MSGFGRRRETRADPVPAPTPAPVSDDVRPTIAGLEPVAGHGFDAMLGEIGARLVEPVPPPAAKPAKSKRAHLFGPAREAISKKLYEQIDLDAASRLSRSELQSQIEFVVAEIVGESNLRLNEAEQKAVASSIVDDMIGLGPLEELLADDSITDILVNGPHQIYVERSGKLVQTDVCFRDDPHVTRVAQRIARAVGRRVDESSPMCDARLLDGSRVNIVLPPLALDGPSISIRKFSRRRINLEQMVTQGNLSANLARVLQIAAACRLNVLVSGGTGSGKTTLLNALSRLIDSGERIVTIEDAAEIQLQQPHVVRLETRPVNSEGLGEITMRSLLKNALRMRPDRIIIGEVRGEEALDMLQAMNTGHDGSLSTIHANRARDALVRLENMVGMAGISLPSKAIRQQIQGAIDLIIQVERMRDGIRRVTSVTEVIGMEGDVITTQDLFTFDYQGETRDGRLIGEFKSSGVRPRFLQRAGYYGLDRALLSAMG